MHDVPIEVPGGSVNVWCLGRRRLRPKAPMRTESLTVEYLTAVNRYTLVLTSGAPAVAAAVAGR